MKNIKSWKTFENFALTTTCPSLMGSNEILMYYKRYFLKIKDSYDISDVLY